MNSKTLVIVLSLQLLLSCEFRKSAQINLVSGLTTAGSGISCGDVYLTDGFENRLNRTSFIYGETFYLNFEDVEGLEKIDNYAFPGMKLYILGQEGDTVMKNDDLYANYTDGMDFSPLLLQANVTAADPIHSYNRYSLLLEIWDKKGEGTFEAKFDFDVAPNSKINVESADILYNEIYLFSEQKNTTIVNNEAEINETVYLIFEGLRGFKEEDGKATIGVSIKATDATGAEILSSEHLLTESAAELANMLAPNYVFTDPGIESPVLCEIVVSDKNSDRRISATTELDLITGAE